MEDAFSATLKGLDDPATQVKELPFSFLSVLPVTGASVSTLGGFLGSQTISATDKAAAWLDELQFDLGEGPCWDAMRLDRPVMEPQMLGRRGTERWPAFGRAVQSGPIASIFAFPLAVGSLRFGAIDLYSDLPVTLDRVQTTRAAALAAVVARRVLRDRIGELEVPDESALSPFSRRKVHQATGIVLAQLNIDADEARLLLHSHAFATESSVMEVADGVLAGQIVFSNDSGPIEVDT
ncbi:GAF and ANTAR domain-containing protein [Microbacterium sp. Leaf159]|uniref:GAF and ANTAR domain-containing protein n=1 Tax=Microbacterium sp. Leaf159 TaxID=1736279 RepID=UPI0006FAA5E5|nr:GAF and ANTAR domain-containing protein [Microbacterium sp. Leaf159]KQR38421.1 hypothetical protein ASF80_02540 [Microbacterium sp. Leaf159]